MHYYLTGDCHGNFTKIELFCRFHKTNLSDTMILLGDVGLNYNLNESDQKRKKRLSNLPLTFFCIHGNHEERPANISSYKKRKWHGGTVYYESEFPNILFAKDGELYNLDGKTAIVCPLKYEPTDLFLRGTDQSRVDKSTEEWLTQIEKNLHSYKAKICLQYSHEDNLRSTDFTPNLFHGFQHISMSI